MTENSATNQNIHRIDKSSANLNQRIIIVGCHRSSQTYHPIDYLVPEKKWELLTNLSAQKHSERIQVPKLKLGFAQHKTVQFTQPALILL